MDNLEVKRVTPKDIDQLQKIAAQTFSETFSSRNTKENMKIYLEERLSIEKLTIELNNKESEFYFGTINNSTIGYLNLNFGSSQTELKDEKAVEIERIYVLNEFQGKKIGQILFEKATQIAKQKNGSYLWLGVWRVNKRAINFYKKNRFSEFDKHIFKLGNEEQIDIMMRLPLEDS